MISHRKYSIPEVKFVQGRTDFGTNLSCSTQPNNVVHLHYILSNYSDELFANVNLSGLDLFDNHMVTLTYSEQQIGIFRPA